MLSGLNTRLKWLISLLVLLLIILFLKERKAMGSPNKIAFEFYLKLKQLGFSPELSKMIIAQAAFETGNFTSNIYKKNNNLFGMKLPEKRVTTATGEKYGHAIYDTVFSSIQDYKYYYQEFGLPVGFNTIRDFVEELKEKGYFEAETEHYIKGVEYYYKIYWDE